MKNAVKRYNLADGVAFDGQVEKRLKAEDKETFAWTSWNANAATCNLSAGFKGRL